jgi:hypothetical protein
MISFFNPIYLYIDIIQNLIHSWLSEACQNGNQTLENIQIENLYFLGKSIYLCYNPRPHLEKYKTKKEKERQTKT